MTDYEVGIQRPVVGGQFIPATFTRASNTTPGQAVSTAQVGGPKRHVFTAGGAVIVPVSLTEAPALFTVGTGTVEPKIPGTNIPIYRITALLDGGMTVNDVKEDFPSLTANQIEAARGYALLFPNLGKPYPQKSLKRLLRDSGFAQLKRAQTRMKLK